MFAIEVDGQFLEIEGTPSLTLNLLNPAYDQDSVDRKFTYPVILSLSPRNKAILQHADRIDTKGKRVYAATLYISHIPYERGELIIDKSTEKVMRAHFASTSIGLNDRLKDIQVNEILDVIKLPYLEDAEKHYLVQNIDFVNKSRTICVNGVDYTINLTTEDAPTDAADMLADLINADYPGLVTIETDEPNKLMIFKSKFHDVEIILKSPEILIVGPLAGEFGFPARAQETLRQHLLDLRDDPDERYSFPLIMAPDYYPDVIDYLGYINYLISGFIPVNQYYGFDGVSGADEDAPPQFLYTIAPCVRVKYIIEAIFEHLDFNLVRGEIYDNEDLHKLSIFTTNTLDWERTDEFFIEGNVRRFKVNGFRTTIDLNKFVPDENAHDFFTTFMESFNLYYIIEGKTIEIRPKLNQLHGSTMNLTLKTEAPFEHERNFNDGETYCFIQDDEDTPTYEDQVQPVVIGPGKEKIEIPYLPLYNAVAAGIRNITEFDFIIWLLKTCTVGYTANSPDYGLSSSPELRYFFDNGRQPSHPDIGGTFIMASNDNIDYEGEALGDLSLQLHTPRGTHDKYFRGWPIESISSLITKSIRLDIQDLLTIRKWETARIRFYHDKGEAEGIIKSIQVTITDAGIQPARVDIIKINPTSWPSQQNQQSS